MGIRRAVPDLTSADLARSRAFYRDFLGFTEEPWGVRRFFVRDPDGKVVNVMSHLTPAG